MMQRLSSLGLLNQTKWNQLDIQEKLIGGTTTKESCYTHQNNIETTLQQVDKIQRLKMIVENLPDIRETIQLSHVPDQYYVLPNSTLVFFEGTHHITIMMLISIIFT